MPQVLFGLFAFLRIAPDEISATGLTRKPLAISLPIPSVPP